MCLCLTAYGSAPPIRCREQMRQEHDSQKSTATGSLCALCQPLACEDAHFHIQYSTTGVHVCVTGCSGNVPGVDCKLRETLMQHITVFYGFSGSKMSVGREKEKTLSDLLLTASSKVEKNRPISNFTQNNDIIMIIMTILMIDYSFSSFFMQKSRN